eukprot:12564133-Alexandrium_andersonii.AAC.1
MLEPLGKVQLPVSSSRRYVAPLGRAGSRRLKREVIPVPWGSLAITAVHPPYRGVWLLATVLTPRA